MLRDCLLPLVFITITSFARRVGRRLALWCGLSILTGCSGLPPENLRLKQRVVQAIRAVEERPVGDSITVDMTAAVDIPWDTLYVFTNTTAPERITAAIGAPWFGSEYVHEDGRLFVFMHRGRIADYVYFMGWNGPQGPDFVRFKGHFERGELFTPATARFRATRSKFPPHIIDLEPPRGSKAILRSGYKPHKINF